ncbi:hypothetical protein [Candidatus Nitrosocosmicus sp. R]
MGQRKKVEKIPDLEVYVVDVWPSMENKNYPITPDYDSTVNRRNGLTYQDKTPYDEKVANMVSDYYNLVNELLKLAKENSISDDKINAILDKKEKVHIVVENQENTEVYWRTGLILQN